RGVPVGRRVAAAHVAARHADAEMHPAIARAQAVLAAAGTRPDAADLSEVAAARARLRLELDRAFGVHPGSRVRPGPGPRNRGARADAEQGRGLGEHLGRAGEDELVAGPDGLA